MLTDIYRANTSLSIDFYNITSAYALWANGDHNQQTCFHMYFRKAPFKGLYALVAGLEYLSDWVRNFRFEGADLDFLSQQVGNDGSPLFRDSKFLDYLEGFRFRSDIDAMLEGTVAFPNEPLVRVVGPVIDALLIETFCLNVINSQTLFATKAARVCQAAQGDPVLEFGLRRAQGVDGGLGASRAAYIGGCSATSNVLAGRMFGIPVKGTHPHAYVMLFDDELLAFEKYAKALPHNVTFLVDTYDTMEGVNHAIQVAKKIQENGYQVAGIRLDSGDLSKLSKSARAALNKAGLKDIKIVASNDLNEHTITQLKQKNAPIAIWGVGTQLSTSYDQPALGGVYKLGAVFDEGNGWTPRIKLSEDEAKVTIPGVLNTRRYYSGNQRLCDYIFDEDFAPTQVPEEADWHEDLLKPVFRAGRFVGEQSTIHEKRSRAQKQLNSLSNKVTDFKSVYLDGVFLEERLSARRQDLIKSKKIGSQ